MSEPAGRPTTYTQEIADDICADIAGGIPLREICRRENMPAISTVLLWVASNRDKFSEQYRNARLAQGYHDADKLRHLADMVIDGEIEPQVAKVAIDTYKWTAERNAAKVYGPKSSVDLSSSDGSMTPKGFNDFYNDTPDPESKP